MTNPKAYEDGCRDKQGGGLQDTGRQHDPDRQAGRKQAGPDRALESIQEAPPVRPNDSGLASQNQPASARGRLPGEDPISVLLVFPSAYLLYHHWGAPLAILGLLGVWLFLNLFFRLIPPNFASVCSGIGAAILYGRAAYLLGLSIYAIVPIAVIAYPLGYLGGVMASQSLYRRAASGR